MYYFLRLSTTDVHISCIFVNAKIFTTNYLIKIIILPEQTGGSPIHCCPMSHTRERLPDVKRYPLSQAYSVTPLQLVSLVKMTVLTNSS